MKTKTAPRKPPYILASVVYLLVAPTFASGLSLAAAFALPTGSPLTGGVALLVFLLTLAAGYVAMILWLRRRATTDDPRPPYVVASIAYWLLVLPAALAPGMVFGHCYPAQDDAAQAACRSQGLTAVGIGFALACVLYAVMLWRLRRRAERRARAIGEATETAPSA